MTLDKLELTLENCIEELHTNIISCLIEAWNDWPIEIEDLDNYFESVREYVGTDKLSFEAITKRLSSVDLSSEAWYAESLSSLEMIFLYASKSNTIEEVVMLSIKQITS